MYAETHERESWLAPKEVARELRVHVSSVYRSVEAGRLPAFRLAETGAIRIPRSALEELGGREVTDESARRVPRACRAP
jgi:excisionase family DNA binding protein